MDHKAFHIARGFRGSKGGNKIFCAGRELAGGHFCVAWVIWDKYMEIGIQKNCKKKLAGFEPKTLLHRGLIEIYTGILYSG
jgi:hypothetical protein